jgi:hypothetical protein
MTHGRADVSANVELKERKGVDNREHANKPQTPQA